MYLIINEDYTVEQTPALNPQLIDRCDNAKISIIDCDTMEGLNSYSYNGGGWVDVPIYNGESDHILTHGATDTYEWIDCEDQLPADGVSVLISTNFGDIYTCRLPVIIEKNKRGSTPDQKCERVTRWRPLPEPPQ